MKVSILKQSVIVLGVTGFVTGKESDTTINKNLATPNLSVNFLDDTVNQTNRLKDYTNSLFLLNGVVI